MDTKENLISIYIYEKNLLKTTTNKLLECTSDTVHDYILNIFDELDELNRYIYNYLISNKYIEQDQKSKKEKNQIYEELDSLYLRINP